MGSEVIDTGLSNIYHSWFAYRKGKKSSINLDIFQYNLEKELDGLAKDLNDGTYKHGSYKKFTVSDNKKREISVATVRDKVMHRLVYDYLTNIFDKTFIYDAWSCRKGKGLMGAVDRTQKFIKKYENGFVWRADVKKFFDNVDHDILLTTLKRKIKDKKTFLLLTEIIKSFSTKKGKGMPIGNLTSQIFSNIYLNELDRYIKHKLKIKAYLRYGDDFLIFDNSEDYLEKTKALTANFLRDKLNLELHAKNNYIVKTKHGLKFLGLVLYPDERRINKRNCKKLRSKLNMKNVSSYWGIVKKHSDMKAIQEFQWELIEKIR
ncbi:MAG: reverse transcriptase/maturase family protein [Candidatus Gracilibacteria bacterium]